MKRLFPIAAALVLALPASSSAATASVKIIPTGFEPAATSVASGDAVTWTNTTAGNHQVVSDEGNFVSGILRPGQSYSFTFKAAGKYAYHDGLHPARTGSVTVTGPPPEVTLGADLPAVTYGNSTDIAGKVSSGDSGDSVVITARPVGSSSQSVATVTTGAGGNFSYSVKPTIQTTYTATWKGATSQSVTIQVRPRLSLSHYTATKLFARASSSISYEGHFVFLQRRASGAWITVKRLTLGPRSGRLFKAPHVRGTRTYRVYLSPGQAGTGYLDSSSNAVRVRYRH